MNDELERKVNCTTDVQEACVLGFNDGYAKGLKDATRSRCRDVLYCNVCGSKLDEVAYYLTSTKLVKGLPPVEVTVGYCDWCFNRLKKIITLLGD